MESIRCSRNISAAVTTALLHFQWLWCGMFSLFQDMGRKSSVVNQFVEHFHAKEPKSDIN